MSNETQVATLLQQVASLYQTGQYGEAIPLAQRSVDILPLAACRRAGRHGDKQSKQESSRKTPAEIARLVWDIFESNPHFGRHRIAMTLWALRVLVAASTVRNVLLRPAPPQAPAAAAVKAAHAKPRKIVARYPNHVWSVDRTRVWRWHIWPTWVLSR